MRVLFVCNQGMHRSRTAAELLKGHETRARGIYANHVRPDDLAWADLVVCMEAHQREEIAVRFPKEYLAKRILVLDVPDIYAYGQPELVRVLRQRLASIVGNLPVFSHAST